jgi:hypothetical protein
MIILGNLLHSGFVEKLSHCLIVLENFSNDVSNDPLAVSHSTINETVSTKNEFSYFLKLIC